MSVTSVRIQEELHEPLEKLAGKLHRSKNWLINEAVREYIARQALEAGKWRETLEALDSVKKGDVVNGEAVQEWLKSWGNKNEKMPPNR